MGIQENLVTPSYENNFVLGKFELYINVITLSCSFKTLAIPTIKGNTFVCPVLTFVLAVVIYINDATFVSKSLNSEPVCNWSKNMLLILLSLRLNSKNVPCTKAVADHENVILIGS